jgi:hypothetical protein
MHFQKHMQSLGASGGLVKSHQHFVASELESHLGDRFVKIQRHEPRDAHWFTATRALRGAILGVELASFPIFEARVP